ncbi:hypothetical protein TNCV_4972921 [Trichonephila clavipes]|nr:hypothetical protein TNCV_4972921 [Trichonephila clavipes]
MVTVDTRVRVTRLMVDNDESGVVIADLPINLSSRSAVALATAAISVRNYFFLPTWNVPIAQRWTREQYKQMSLLERERGWSVSESLIISQSTKHFIGDGSRKLELLSSDEGDTTDGKPHY